MRALFDRLEPIHGDQTVAMARWTVKTLILWHHPKTEFTHIDHLHRKGWSPGTAGQSPRAMLEMRDSGRIPKDVSVAGGDRPRTRPCHSSERLGTTRSLVYAAEW